MRREISTISQILPPQPLRMPGTQGQFCQELSVPQPMNFVPGSSFRLSPHEGCSRTRSCTGYTAVRGFLQNWSLLPSQNVSKDAGPHGLKRHHVLVHSDSVTVVSYINHQGRLTSKRLFKMVKSFLEWAHLNLRSLRAAHVPAY